MGFQTPLYKLSEYMQWTTTGKIQLPDFQREFKWDDDRIRSLLVTVLRGHPLGVVMLLKTGNDQIRFKPRPVEGVSLPVGVGPVSLLLDGQQRLTSLTQALTGVGIVATIAPVPPTTGVIVVQPRAAVNDTNVVSAGMASLSVTFCAGKLLLLLTMMV